MERLAQYIIRNPFSVDKMQPNSSGDSIIYRSGMNPKIGRNFEVFSPCELTFVQAVSLRSALGRNPAGLERGDVDVIALGRIHGFGVRPLEPLAAHIVGIPSVIAHELEAFVGDLVRGNSVPPQPTSTGSMIS